MTQRLPLVSLAPTPLAFPPGRWAPAGPIQAPRPIHQTETRPKLLGDHRQAQVQALIFFRAITTVPFPSTSQRPRCRKSTSSCGRP